MPQQTHTSLRPEHEISCSHQTELRANFGSRVSFSMAFAANSPLFVPSKLLRNFPVALSQRAYLILACILRFCPPSLVILRTNQNATQAKQHHVTVHDFSTLFSYLECSEANSLCQQFKRFSAAHVRTEQQGHRAETPTRVHTTTWNLDNRTAPSRSWLVMAAPCLVWRAATYRNRLPLRFIHYPFPCRFLRAISC